MSDQVRNQNVDFPHDAAQMVSNDQELVQSPMSFRFLMTRHYIKCCGIMIKRPFNRLYLESAIFEMCMISIFILVPFESK